MNLDLGVVFSNLIGLFLLLGTGYVAVKGNIIPLAATTSFSAFLLRIALPCIIFSSMMQPFDPEFLMDSAAIVAVNTLLFALNLLLGYLLSKLLRVSEGSRGTWCILVAFCNNGFMGFPVVLALFGEEGLALAAMICIPFNLLMYSAAPYLMGKDAGTGANGKFSLNRVLLTPINIAVILGLSVFLLQIPVPGVLLSPIRFFANTTTPLSMFVTGMLLSQVKLSELFREKDVWAATAVRLLLFPALALLVLWLIPFRNILVPSITLITLAMPSAAIVTTLAETYHGDRAMAAKVIFLTSLLCILTIPLFSTFL